MKSELLKVSYLVALTAFAGVLDGNAGELVVEPGGLSAQGAIERIREARKAGDSSKWTVTVKGTNCLESPILLNEDDFDIAFVGEGEAMFSGGLGIVGWKEVGDGVWEADAPRLASGETAHVDELWVDGRRAANARLPNEGYFNIARSAQTELSAGNYRECTVFTNDEVKALAKLSPEELGFVKMDVVLKWSYATREVVGFDLEKMTVETHSRHRLDAWKPWNATETLIAFENVRTAFDAPGEWLLDMKAGKLRYRPKPGEDMAKLSAVVPRHGLSRLVDICGDYAKGKWARNISFRGIGFCHTAIAAKKNRITQIHQHQAADSMDGVVTLAGARNIVFDHCRFEHTANYGLRFDSGCVSNRVTVCRLDDLGAGGIWMGSKNDCQGKGDAIARKVLKANRLDSTAYNEISDCTITRGGRYHLEGTGVALAHCSDTRVVHNEIRDFYYTGISVGWTWGYAGSVAQRNEIAYNRISDLGKSIMSDMGGVYTLGTSFGTKVHHNEIHDVWSYSYGGWALYTDEGSEGIVMENNICWNTTDGGFHQHYGVGCEIRNNVFAYNRKLGAVRTARAMVAGVPSTLHFCRNIVCVREGPLAGRGVRNVQGVWGNNLWYDERGEKAAEFDGAAWSAWVRSGKEFGSAFADPRFENAAGFDFRLKPDSPALALGFKPIDMKGIGPRQR